MAPVALYENVRPTHAASCCIAHGYHPNEGTGLLKPRSWSYETPQQPSLMFGIQWIWPNAASVSASPRPVLPPSIPRACQSDNNCSHRHQTLMSYLAPAIFTDPASVFSDQHHQPPVSIPAAGRSTAGPGWDRGAHLWRSPGSPNTSTTASHKMQFFQIFADCNRSAAMQLIKK